LQIVMYQTAHLVPCARNARTHPEWQIAQIAPSIAETAGWDEEMLRRELATLQDLDFDLSLTGFGEDELAQVLSSLDDEAEMPPALPGDPDFVPDLPTRPVSERGWIWQLGNHLVGCAVRRYAPHGGHWQATAPKRTLPCALGQNAVC